MPERVTLQTSLNSSNTCLECNQEFESSRSYRFHMRVHHVKVENDFIEVKIEPEDVPEMSVMEIKQEPKKFHVCDICQKGFVAVISLNAHKKFRHSIEPAAELEDEDIQVVNLTSTPVKKKSKKEIQHECEVCDVVLFRKDYLQSHVRIVHPGEYVCPFCPRINHFYVDLINHMKSAHPNSIFDDTKLYDCVQCIAKFWVKENLNIHMMEKHVKNPVVNGCYCAPCKTTYFHSISHLRHIQHSTHKEMSEVYASLQKKRQNIEIVNEPMEEESVGMKVNNIPQRRNSTTNQDKKYIKYFLTNTDFGCLICKQKFTNRKSLIRHLKTHNEIRTMDCPMCPSKFFFKIIYNKHLKTHKTPRAVANVEDSLKITCNICQHLFTSKKSLMIHIEVRHNVKNNLNFKCGFCGILHDNEDELMRHFKTHTDNHEDRVHVKGEIVESEELEKIKEETEELEEVKEEPEENENVNEGRYCQICKHVFSFKIMYNNHISIWHNESNPNKHLTRVEQKRIKENEKNIIKFTKCKLCDEVFIKPDDLVDHVKTKHSSTSNNDNSDDEQRLIIDETETSKTEFNCDKCILSFPCQLYLTNHQKYFCLTSPKVVCTSSENENLLNEQ